MKSKPLMLTELALGRILKELAKRLGLEDTMADAVAQIHLQQSDSARNWNAWLLTNCAECQKDPTTCEFFNPKPENCLGNATPHDVRTANCLMLETGRFTRCPALKQTNPA